MRTYALSPAQVALATLKVTQTVQLMDPDSEMIFKITRFSPTRWILQLENFLAPQEFDGVWPEVCSELPAGVRVLES